MVQRDCLFAFTDDERAFLRQLRALATDSRGNEVLAGLTLEETAFYVEYGRAWVRGHRAGPEAREKYLALYRRHEHHRQATSGSSLTPRSAG